MTELHSDTLPGLIGLQACASPDRVAVSTTRDTLTYGELHDEMNAVANGLSELGVTRGSKVGLMCTNRTEWLVAALAATRLGATVYAFNTWARKWDLRYMLQESECEVLIALSRFRETDIAGMISELVAEAFETQGGDWHAPDFPSLKHIILVTEDPVAGVGVRRFGDLRKPPSGELPGYADSDRVMFVMFTSGSTARPKAVPLYQGTAIEHARDVADRMGVAEADVIFLPVPLFWSYGGANALLVGLVTGSTLVLQEAFDASEALDLIESNRCTVAYTLPNITAGLLNDPAFSKSRIGSLKKGMTIGSPADIEQAATGLGIAAVCNAYGSTELYAGCCVTPSDWPLERKMTCQGPPLPQNTVSIQHPETRELLPVGEIGEICVHGQVTPRYLGQPELSIQAFTPEGEFRTGDLGFFDDEGAIHFVARASEMIRSGGINIAPAEVEEFLRQHEGVAEVAVVGVPDRAKDEIAVACVTARSDASVSEEELKSFCSGEIASYKIPVRFVVLEQPLPRTDTGKLSRSAVQELAARMIGAPEKAQSGTPEEIGLERS